MDIKTEGLSFVKTLGAIAASLGAVWGYTEPIVENYIHEQIKVVQEQDMKEIKKLEKIIDHDHESNKTKRNEIIEEIQYFYPQTRLKIEK